MAKQQGHHNGGRDRPGRQDRQGQQNARLSGEEKQKILAGDAATIDEVAERFAEQLGNKLNRTQMRNFYTPFTRIRASRNVEERKKAVIQHRARTAYLVAREKKAEPIWDLFEGLLKRADSTKQIDALCDLAEALIAYHRRESERGGSAGKTDSEE